MLQIIIIAAAVAADQLTKFLLVPMLLEAPGHSVPIIKDIFHLTYVPNPGASFGILPGSQVFFIIITSVILIAATVFMIKTRKIQKLFLKITLSLIISGALGNFIDRVLFGYVRDMFDFSGIGFFPWVFNVADACLVVGSILLGVYIIFIYKEKDGKRLFAKHTKTEQENKDTAE